MKFKYKLDGDSGFLEIYELNNIESINLYRRSEFVRKKTVNSSCEVSDYDIYMLTDLYIAYIKYASYIKNSIEELHLIYKENSIILDTSIFYDESIEIFKLNDGVLKI